MAERPNSELKPLIGLRWSSSARDSRSTSVGSPRRDARRDRRRVASATRASGRARARHAWGTDRPGRPRACALL